MILVLSVFVTNQRNYNSYSRIDIFRYMLKSYKKIPFTEVYLFVLLDTQFQIDLTDYIYDTFAHLPTNKIHIVNDRYCSQVQWEPFIKTIYHKHGPEEAVWFTQNDDHIFVDFNTEILEEGLKILHNESSRHKSIYFSHWPEILKLSGKHQQPKLVNNYVKFNLSLLDSIQIFNLQFLYDIMVDYKWKNNHIRIDSVLNEVSNDPSNDNPLNQTIYVPLREMVRHFDGYDHVCMDRESCPPLQLPSNTFLYTKDVLIKKMTAKHHSVWTQNNSFLIPQEWVVKNLNLHESIDFFII